MRSPRGNRYNVRDLKRTITTVHRLRTWDLAVERAHHTMHELREAAARLALVECPPTVFYQDGRKELTYATGPAFEYAQFSCTNAVLLVSDDGPVDAVDVDRPVLTRHRFVHRVLPGVSLYAYFAEEQRSVAENWADAWFGKMGAALGVARTELRRQLPYVDDLVPFHKQLEVLP